GGRGRPPAGAGRMSAVRARWLAATVVMLLVAGALVWSTVGGNRRQSASPGTGGQAGGVPQGGPVDLGGGGDPTGFKINPSKDHGADVRNIITNVYPSVFRTHP